MTFRFSASAALSNSIFVGMSRSAARRQSSQRRPTEARGTRIIPRDEILVEKCVDQPSIDEPHVGRLSLYLLGTRARPGSAAAPGDDPRGAVETALEQGWSIGKTNPVRDLAHRVLGVHMQVFKAHGSRPRLHSAIGAVRAHQFDKTPHGRLGIGGMGHLPFLDRILQVKREHGIEIRNRVAYRVEKANLWEILHEACRVIVQPVLRIDDERPRHRRAPPQRELVGDMQKLEECPACRQKLRRPAAIDPEQRVDRGVVV